MAIFRATVVIALSVALFASMAHSHPATTTSMLTTIAAAANHLQYPSQINRQTTVNSNSALNCTDVKIPPKMCPLCHLRPFDNKGEFNTSYGKDIIAYETPECMEQIKEYVRLNPCDDKRAKYLAQLKTSSFARNRIAQFLYSICEQCCDCVPFGAKVDEYEERKMNDTLYHLTRGNCPAHFHYDICKMFPDVRRLIPPTWKVRGHLTPVCPLVAEWITTDDATWWAGNPDVKELSPRILFSLKLAIRHSTCSNRRVWQDCVRMESAQGRI